MKFFIMYFCLNFIYFLCFTSKHFPRTLVLKHLHSVPAHLHRVFKFCLRIFSDLRRSYVLQDPVLFGIEYSYVCSTVYVYTIEFS